MNPSTAENRMRSANPPMTSAGVMMAKVIWNMKNRVSGMVPLSASRVTSDQECLIESANEGLCGTAVGERERVADGQPQQRHDAGDGETLHQDGEHVLGAHQAGVEQREARQGHEQNQGGCGDDPGRITRVRGRRGGCLLRK